MAQTPSADNLYLGKGALYFDKFDSSGNRTGELHLGDVSSFAITTEDDKIEHYESQTKSAGLYAEALTKRTVTLKAKLHEFVKENLELFLMGSIGALTQTGTTVTDETITTSSKQGRYYACDYRSISSVTVKSGTSTPYTTRTVNTDYTIDTKSGRIYIVPGGGIVDGHTVQVSYTYATIDLKTVRGGTESSIKGYMRFKGDPSAGPEVEVEVWKVSATPDGELGLIGNEYGGFDITFKVLSDATNHASEPYYRMIYI